ncbi:hypothetical protein Pmar_PMAR002059 [Perkinsus marinus ATCC 50983]|uniref:RRM domain-containing protein n=1 Tax=Perkinsus marinus (strain ATCC 50983 / TXsc) TaxID=423536 RepID=C5LYK2_PERM5|nr:hypothetical protein Pmar_PMAR002059 [Perkinsus marinus ATCC 50983]EEQ98240.1 hypothetical protein Pmar_PMAR002059 [Perkinsus marinus ATCC 50983]|eukprot:XP_002765523.1 hypothetical protein Pmar_PMAR002059 [Perkinsus marinus ATCC 50983]
MYTPQHLNEAALIVACNSFQEQLQDERRRSRELEEQNHQLKRLLTEYQLVRPEDYDSRTPDRNDSALLLTPAAMFDGTPVVGGGYCLPELLKQLDQEQEACIFIVRKIHKLRFQSASILEQYFSGFGEVKKVLLLPWRRQKSVGPHPGKARPASMGFVVMKSPMAVSNILALSQHTVAGWPISVQVFERQADKCGGDSRRSSITSDFFTYEWSSPASTAATPAVEPGPFTVDSGNPVDNDDYSPALFAAESVLRGLTDDFANPTGYCHEYAPSVEDLSVSPFSFISQPVNPDRTPQ